jgi:hypothetical protein
MKRLFVLMALVLLALPVFAEFKEGTVRTATIWNPS